MCMYHMYFSSRFTNDLAEYLSQTGQSRISLFNFQADTALDQVLCLTMIGGHYKILQRLQESSLLQITGLAQYFLRCSVSGLLVQQPLDLVEMQLAGMHTASFSLIMAS